MLCAARLFPGAVIAASHLKASVGRVGFLLRAVLSTLIGLALVSSPITRRQAARAEDLRNPPERKSGGGELSTALKVAYSDNTIGDKKVHLRNYEGMITGPTLRVRPGDTLNVLLCNRLPPEPAMAAGHVRAPAPAPKHHFPHGFNTTNLHTHGLHVSPAGNSDNVFLEIGPGQDFPLEIKIPRNHHPGTFWYHAHKHGSVALQLASGMGGALIVEGGLDDVEPIRCARERVLVFQQVAFDKNGQVEGDYYPSINQSSQGPQSVPNLDTTINGQLRPEIRMRPGEVQRWRMVHAGIEKELNLVLEGHKLNEIACDGIALGRVAPRDSVLLYPGYRSDVLIQALKPGRHDLTAITVTKEIALHGVAHADEVLATVVVDGDPVTMRLPTDDDVKGLAPFPSIDTVQGQVAIEFKLSNGWGLVNTVEFDPDDTMNVLGLKLGTAQEWQISTPQNQAHPFHIHINPFQVILKRDAGGAIVESVWKDTYVVTKGNNVNFRIRYAKYIGRSVLHCHNLLHEDVGMMQAIDIEP